MLLRRVIDGVPRDFNDERLIADNRLARQARLRLEPPRFIEVIFLEFVSLTQRIKTLPHNDMAGRAGA